MRYTIIKSNLQMKVKHRNAVGEKNGEEII